MNRVDTTHILDLIAEYDNREVTADMIGEWSYDIGHLDKEAALEAVNIHHKTSGERITTAHVLDIAGQIAQRVEIKPRMRRAVMSAYQVGGALNEDCEDCGAAAGETCTSPVTQQESHAPCLRRITGKRKVA